MPQYNSAPKEARKSGYNPHKYRRQVRQAPSAVDGVKPFTVKSMTSDDKDQDPYTCGVDTRTGEVFCACGNFYFHHQKYSPTLAAPTHWCKHLKQTIRGMARRGELRLVHDDQGVLLSAEVRFEAPQLVGRIVDAEHDEYAADLERRAWMESDPNHYTTEVDWDDDPQWFERAVLKAGPKSRYRA